MVPGQALRVRADTIDPRCQLCLAAEGILDHVLTFCSLGRKRESTLHTLSFALAISTWRWRSAPRGRRRTRCNEVLQIGAATCCGWKGIAIRYPENLVDVCHPPLCHC